MPLKIFLDANIIFSASQLQSPSWQLLDRLSKNATLITHTAVWDEAQRNLLLKRPAWSAGLDYWLERVIQSQMIGPCPDAGLPPKDAPILAAAIASKADRLLTGDLKHFGHLYGRTFQGVLIVSPRLLSEEIVNLGWTTVDQGLI
jgi:predicted nucleic acid-binding protein